MAQSSRLDQGAHDDLPSPGWIGGLPKCELHVHVEGTLEADLAEQLARRHCIPVPPRRPAGPAAYDGLADFLADYYAAMDVLRRAADFEALATAYLGRAAADGVTHAEVFFDPQAHTSRGVAFGEVVDGLAAACAKASAAGGPTTSLIACVLRDATVASAEETLDSVLRRRADIVGLGLDSDEAGHPPADFADTFARARAAGLRLTMHCDPRQPEAVTNLWQCLEVIDVERIDHGVDCLADDDLVDAIGGRRLGLTACPLSNRVLYGDMMADDIAALLARGLLVTVNSDDPAYFGGYVADNYSALADAGFSRADLVALARNSFEASWLAEPERRAHLAALDAYVAASRCP